MDLDELKASIGERDMALSADEMRRMGHLVVDLIADHMEGLDAAPVAQLATARQMEAQLQEPIPEDGTDLEDVLEQFSERVMPYAMQVGHPRFFASVPTSPTYIGILAEALSAACNFNIGSWIESPGPTTVEKVVMGWMRELLDLPETTEGLFTSSPHLVAIAVARHQLLGGNMDRAMVYFTRLLDPVVRRALHTLGFRDDQLVEVGSDTGHHMPAEVLLAAIEEDLRFWKRPFLVVASGGTDTLGVVDPLPEIAQVCQDRGLWLHVDASYGGLMAVTERGKAALEGLGRADSISIDPHKGLFVPFVTSCVMVRDGDQLRRTFEAMAPSTRYVHPLPVAEEDEQDTNLGDRSFQLNRTFDALKVWMGLKVYGLQRYREQLDHCLDLAEFVEAFAEEAENLEFLSREFSIVLFRYRVDGYKIGNKKDRTFLDDLNLELVRRMSLSGDGMVSAVEVGDAVWLRMCILSHLTQIDDVERVLEQITEEGDAVLSDP